MAGERRGEFAEERGDVGFGVVAVERDAEPPGVVHEVDLSIVEKPMDELGPRVAEGENPRELRRIGR